MTATRTQTFSSVRRVVVKAGSGILTGRQGLNLAAINAISADICRLMNRNLEVLFVSSGALASGEKRIGLSHHPTALPERQAVAAIGQAGLILEYETAFARHDRHVAQILLTSDDLASRKRYLNARNTLNTLLSWKIIPIINENDTVAVEEIKFGDNDNLAAQITLLMDADILINLTDIDGLYDKDPRQHPEARLLSDITSISKKLEDAASSIPGALGTGGMLSKLKAAKKLMRAGIPMIIANGGHDRMLWRLFQGEAGGTFFHPGPHRLSCKKRWIAFGQRPKGALVVDDGAAGAISRHGKSLLPGGIKTVNGDFGMGTPVEILSQAGTRLGTGLVNYGSDDIRRIMGLKTCHIQAALGHHPYDEIIHRDNMVTV